MKLPKNWNKLTNEQQRLYIAERLQSVRNEEQELVNLYRSLVLTPRPILFDIDRPDLDILKSEQ